MYHLVKRALLGFVAAGALGSAAVAATPPPNFRPLGYAEATATQTFATTSYADLAAATLTFTPTIDPTIVEAGGATVTHTERVHVWWNADVSKATGTTGSCAIYVNGAIVAATERFSHFSAGRNTISGIYDVTLTSAASQVVKVQCRSADTSVFTVTAAGLYAEEVYR